MKRVLFIIQDRTLPSSRIRVCDLLPDLKRLGIRGDVMEYPRTWMDKFRMFGKLPDYDIVYLQKKLPSPVESRLLKWRSKWLAYDFDDAVYLRHESEGDDVSRSRSLKTAAILKRADVAVAGNRILAQYAASHGARVAVVPSCVDMRDKPVRDHARAEGRTVIGWIGGKINLGHLRLLGPVLQRLSARHDIELRIICNAGIDIPGVRVTLVPWQKETQDVEIARFDIGVMPLPSSRHAEGKCGYKAIQCMAAGVPVVVSDVGINREVVEHGINGFVAGSIDAFEPLLEKLVQSRELRAELGMKARQKVETSYSVERGARLLADVLHAG